MLSVLFWILCGAGTLCLIVFPGKRKGIPLVSGRDDMIAGAACNIASVTFLLTQMIFPLYGYGITVAPSAFYHNQPVDSKWMRETIEGFISVIEQVAVNFNYNFPADTLPGNSVYLFVILTAVLCFFAGVCIYKNGLKIKHKIFLLIPLLVLIAASVWSRATHLSAGFRAAGFLRLQLIYMADGIVRYLYGACMMIALLYGIYLLLKKLFRNEIIPLLVILVLSFFTPFIRIVNDGMMRQGPELRYLQLGPGIPLFPLGMLAMKFKDNILPKTGKGFLTHIVSWVMLGGISFYSLSALQRFLLNRAGLRISDGYSCMPDENFGRTVATLEKIYRLECIPWLVFGFALSMFLFVMISFVRTGNPVTKFCSKNCYLISVMLFSRHIFMVINMKDMSFWTGTVGLKDSLTVIVPFIYFVMFAVLSCLVNKILKKHELKKL